MQGCSWLAQSIQCLSRESQLLRTCSHCSPQRTFPENRGSQTFCVPYPLLSFGSDVLHYFIFQGESVCSWWGLLKPTTHSHAVLRFSSEQHCSSPEPNPWCQFMEQICSAVLSNWREHFKTSGGMCSMVCHCHGVEKWLTEGTLLPSPCRRVAAGTGDVQQQH